MSADPSSPWSQSPCAIERAEASLLASIASSNAGELDISDAMELVMATLGVELSVSVGSSPSRNSLTPK